MTSMERQVREAERQRDDAHTAYEKAARERDAAVARAEGMDRDYRECQESLIEVSLERDEWKARAEQAEREPNQARDDERLHAWGRVTRHPFFDRIQFASGTLTDAMLAALDDAMQPAPAVSRADIEKALRKAFTEDCGLLRTTNAVWALVSGDDPAVYVVRDSEVTAVPLKHDRNGWNVGQTWYQPLSRGEVKDLLTKEKHAMVRTLAIARAIGVEAEQAVDPVDEQTDALADILYGHEMVTDQMRGVLERVVRAGMLFPGQEEER